MVDCRRRVGDLHRLGCPYALERFRDPANHLSQHIAWTLITSPGRKCSCSSISRPRLRDDLTMPRAFRTSRLLAVGSWKIDDLRAWTAERLWAAPGRRRDRDSQPAQPAVGG
jgi:hypothetical protein